MGHACIPQCPQKPPLSAAMPLQYCKAHGCKVCSLQQLNCSNEDIVSIATNKSHSFDINGSCKTSMCVYLITCKNDNCQKYYVGKTVNSINTRLSGHRGHIINKTEGQAMFSHFTKTHSISDMRIQPIEVVEDKNTLGKREKFWIKELNSAYPYGLNNRLDFDGFHDVYEMVRNGEYSKSLYTTFNVVTNNRVKSNNRPSMQKSPNEPFDPSVFIQHLSQASFVNLVHDCRTQIMKSKKTPYTCVLSNQQ